MTGLTRAICCFIPLIAVARLLVPADVYAAFEHTTRKINNAAPAVADTSTVSTDGRLPVGSAGKGDSTYILGASIVRDGELYRMWYGGYDGSSYRIFHATSPDGLAWTKYNNDIPAESDGASTDGRIPLGTAGQGDSAQVAFPSVVKDGGLYWMWYSGSDGSNWRIYAATSHNGLAWTKVNNAAHTNSNTTSDGGRIPRGISGGDTVNVQAPFVMKDGALFRMWYSGAADATYWRTYMATSPDGLTWTKVSNAVPANSNTTSTGGRIPRGTSGGDNYHASRAGVVKDGDTYRMWYTGFNNSNYRIYQATSSNALDWVKLDNTLPGVSDTTNSFGRIGLGTSGKGDQSHALCPAAVLKEDGVYRIWYSGYLSPSYRLYHAVQEAPTPVVSNRPAESITASSADLVGHLVSTGAAPAELHVVWGQTDEGQDAGAWDVDVTIGTVEAGVHTNSLNTLAGATRYFYRFYASNEHGTEWARETAAFSTAGAPTVGNLAPTNLSSIAARLRGEVLGGYPDPDTYICWGTSDPATLNTGDWAHVVAAGTAAVGAFEVDIGGLAAGETYYYRAYAINAHGEAWASATASLEAPGGMTRTWTGIGDWSTPERWSPAGAPGPLDDAVIESGLVTVSAPVTNGSLHVKAGTTLLVTNWLTCIESASNVLIEGRVTLPPPFPDAGPSNRVWFACSNLTVASGGRIDADYRGYARGTSTANGQGPGRGLTGGNGGGGAGHGGGGTRGYNGGAGEAYGVPEAPLAPGSGGGGCSSYPAIGGHGGGAVRIQAAGTVTIDGTITANGQTSADSRGGGGSGGGVSIECRLFAGTGGLISATGGNSTGIGGGGGGGRIAVVCDGSAQELAEKPRVRLSTKPGESSSYGIAGLGSLYFPDTAVVDPVWIVHDGVLRIPSFAAWSVDRLTMSNGWLSIPSDVDFTLTATNDVQISGANGRLDLYRPILSCGGDLVLTNGGRLFVYAKATNGIDQSCGALVSVTNDMIVGAGAQLIPVSQNTNGGSVLVLVQDLTVEAGGQINADARGFAGALASQTAGYGPGRGARRGDNNSGGGAGYGGAGGAGYGGVAGGVTYGSSNAPVLPGSGGGSGNGAAGYGGGLARIEARQRVTIDGTISANGSSVGGNGCGSGGGIFVRSRIFNGGGSGLLRAEGGSGGGGGGGGRIAIHAGLAEYQGVASVTNGTGAYTPAPAPGTIVWIDMAPAVSNIAAVDVTGTEAWLVGHLWSTGGVLPEVAAAPAGVYCFWGTADGGTNREAWSTNDYLGMAEIGLVSNGLSGLAPQTQYYYRFYATNEWGGEWAEATFSFSTVGGPVVNNGVGPTDVAQTSATLNGDVVSGNPMPAAFFCWGDNDAGSASTGNWDAVIAMGPQLGPFSAGVTGLPANKTYYYRCYVENSFGPAWSPETTNFTTQSPEVEIRDVTVVEGDSGTTSAVFEVRLSSASAIAVSVDFSAADETAEAGSDYVATNGTLTVPAGATSGVIEAVVQGDGEDEYPSETFLVELSNAVALVIVDAVGRGEIMDEDDVSEAKVWTGIGNWTSATNWTPYGMPSLSDDVTVGSGSVTLSNSQSVASVVVTNGATVVLTNWTTCLTAPEMAVASGGVVTVAGPFLNSSMSNRVWLACSNLAVQGGGRIHADARGYAGGTPTRGGQGPGGAATGASGACGASHGGRGGTGYDGWGVGAVYGVAFSPLAPGSGGGGSTVSGENGGHGGGAVLIEATGMVTLDGTVSADGSAGGSRCSAGSGGAILIVCRAFQGTGGHVRAAAGQSGWLGGISGGGRVAVACTDPVAQGALPKPRVTLSAARGSGGYDNGDIGTLHLVDETPLDPVWLPHVGVLTVPGFTNWAVPALTVSNGWIRMAAAGMRIEVDQDAVLAGGAILQLAEGGDLVCGGDLRLTGGSRLYAYGGVTNGALEAEPGARVVVEGALRVTGGAILYPVSHFTNGGSVLVRAMDVEIDAASQINANGKGFGACLTENSAGFGPGRGFLSGYGGGGGGYGGRGGAAGSGGGGRGAMCGTQETPVYPGSGAGCQSYGSSGGYGGGLVRLEAAGSMSVEGTVTANGQSGASRAGGGSGGGVYITARRFSGGSGAVLCVNGGDGSGWSGGGAGGRIAVWYNATDSGRDLALQSGDPARLWITPSIDQYRGTTSAAGGVGDSANGATAGDAGTVVFIKVLPPPGTVFVVQ